MDEAGDGMTVTQAIATHELRQKYPVLMCQKTLFLFLLKTSKFANKIRVKYDDWSSAISSKWGVSRAVPFQK